MIDPFAAYPGCVVLDGGLATELERRGADLRDPLWSARVLVEDPALIVEVHRAYVTAGADVITGASYQASFEGLAARGLDREAASRLLARSVELAREAVDDRRVLVAASVGPYGAVLANGAEYTGDYGLGAASTARAALRDFHLPRAEVLAAAGPDLLAIETIPSVVEAEALVEVLDALADVPAWVSFSCRDGDHLSDGTSLEGRRLDRRLEPAGRRGRRELHPSGLRARAAPSRARDHGQQPWSPTRTAAGPGTPRPRRGPATRSPTGSDRWRWICGRPGPA